MNAGPSSSPGATAVGFGQVKVVCVDLAESLAFYRDALGLPELQRVGGAVRLALGQ